MRPFFIAALLLLPLNLPASADPAGLAPLRIGLDHVFRHSTFLLLSCDRPFTLTDALSNRVLAHGKAEAIFEVAVKSSKMTLTRTGDPKGIRPAEGSAALIAQASGASFVKIARMDSSTLGTKGIPWRSYRGFLTVRQEPDNTLRVINTVPLETYLYGVIPAEIGSDVPLEAMKAQAVAARTYALKNRGKCRADGFDLDDTTHCEGYLGVNGETALSNAAVDDTRGQVLTYNGRLIDAPYSTDSGGMTACDGDCPYLQAVRDADPTDGLDYANHGRYHTWTQTFTPTQIAALLARDPRTQVAQFLSLTLDGLDASGRITTATVTGADGTLKTVTGPQLRQIMGYDLLRSTRVTLTRTPEGDYRFDGKGWGHGLGMSQDGAVAMASPPYRKSYLDILKHYYVGVQLAEDWTVSGTQVARHGF